MIALDRQLLTLIEFIAMRPNPALNPDAPSAWLLYLRERRRRSSVAHRAGAPATLYR
jgi:hypothetical protein